jgi:uncharacterized protein (UPF0303 family)
LRFAQNARPSAPQLYIRSASRRLFFAALPSSAADNDDWARRKGNVVLRRHESSMLAGEILKLENRLQ